MEVRLLGGKKPHASLSFLDAWVDGCVRACVCVCAHACARTTCIPKPRGCGYVCVFDMEKSTAGCVPDIFAKKISLL